MKKQNSDSRESYLLNLAKEGDTRSVIQLFEPFYQRIYTYAYLLCGNIEDAEEVVHAGLHDAVQAISELKGNSETFALKHIREHALRKIRQQGYKPPSQGVLLALARAMEYHDEEGVVTNLTAALDLLSVEEKEAFILAAVLDYSPVLAQEITGVKPEIVQSRLTRAFNRLSNAPSF